MLRFGFFAGFRSFTGRERLAGVVAMLHDVLEDADEEALAPVASWLSDEEAEALRLLTRERGSYDEYVERIATAGNRIAVLVKRRAGGARVPLRPTALRLIVGREPRGHQRLACPLPGPLPLLVSLLSVDLPHLLEPLRLRCRRAIGLADPLDFAASALRSSIRATPRRRSAAP